MRLVSLCPSITRLIYDLGAGDQLIGITKYCIDPPDLVAKIEKVGGTKDPKLDRILDLKPDLVLMNQEENRKEDHDLLVEAGVNCHVTFPQDVASTLSSVTETGAALGCEAAASKLNQQIQVAWDQAREKREARNHLRWAYLIWRKPWMAVAASNYVHALIEEVGGTNIFGSHAQTYPAIEAEDLAAANPHLVFLSSEPFPFKEKHRKELAEATGLPISRFVLVSGEMLSWHGCYTVQGLHLAQKLLDEACLTNEHS